MGSEGHVNIPDFTGRTLRGRYELVRRIGFGGMATVYAAVDRQIDKPVAVKVLNPAFFHNADYFARFRQEAFSAAKIRHPQLVDVTDFGDDDGVAYFVMELLEGESLSDRLHRVAGPMPWAEALAIIVQVCDALAYAHERGVVHRDVKPGNVFLVAQPGRPGQVQAKLLDLGIAKVLREALELRSAAPETRLSQGTPGTPEYMAPEQAMGYPVDHRADIYALGVTLYRMLTGHLPFYSPVSVFEVQRMHVELPPVALRLLAPDAGIPVEVEVVVLQALEKQPEDRFETARALADALLAAQHAALVRPLPPAEDTTLQVGRRAPESFALGRLSMIVTVFAGLLTMATLFMLLSLYEVPGVKAFVARQRGPAQPELVELREPFQAEPPASPRPAGSVELAPIDLFDGAAPPPRPPPPEVTRETREPRPENKVPDLLPTDGSAQAKSFVLGKLTGIASKCRDPRAASPIVINVTYNLVSGVIEARPALHSTRGACVKQALEALAGKKNLGTGKVSFPITIRV